MQRRFWAACVAAFIVLMVAACGGGHTTATVPSVTVATTSSTGAPTTTVESLTEACPPGGGFMGCSAGSPKTYSLKAPAKLKLGEALPSGAKFPDVSEYQGCSLDWRLIGAIGAVVKLGEGDYEHDSCAPHNIAGLRAAHKAVITYWFMRPIGVTAEAAYIVAALKAQGITVSHVIEYSSPGTYSGGACLPLFWIAAYSGGAHPPEAPCSTAEKAWQLTDGVNGTPVKIAGLGYGDVSVDYGMLSYAPHAVVLDTEVSGLAGYDVPVAAYILKHDPVPAPKPKPVTTTKTTPTPVPTPVHEAVSCKPYRSQKTAAACRAVKAKGKKLEAEIASERKLLRGGHCYAEKNKKHGRCPAELKHGDTLHAELKKLLA